LQHFTGNDDVSISEEKTSLAWHKTVNLLASSVADPAIFERGVPPWRWVYKGGGFHYYFWFSKGGSTLKMRYFKPILAKFSEERGGGEGSDPRNHPPPSGSANDHAYGPPTYFLYLAVR
jgi:hypothetical protein